MPLSCINTEFEGYYQNIYGSRWEGLRAGLLKPALSVSYGEGLSLPYMLGRSSILAALSLRLPEEGLILDACAAPGGKSLVIASVMGRETRLLANELSGERRRRLVDVLNRHLDGETRSRVTVSGFDAAALGGREGDRRRFAGILLDVPCSAERHVLGNEAALSKWKPARPRFLARRQWALLSAAFLLLREGGSLVYATCSLAPEENDGVCSRLEKKYGKAVVPDEPDFAEGEKTAFGRIILPDRENGMGPMYVARFKKA
ncbi:MAG: 16S rRNA methyltransferase [Spirochaetaceae bacterium]|jgi:16S rRNA (cytosine1407-C5)-methyltransferase|nr:16S rRNA methyltransferase [Spirochaetaceae bacterium]